MKKYKKVELIAKNQVSGSYAAGCPCKVAGDCLMSNMHYGCTPCQRSH